MILSERGARVTAAVSAADGLERLRAGATPNVLVSDVGMPGQDGYAFVRELRRREAPGAHLPAIALTAFARPQDRETALAAGFDEHCGKPLRPDLLVAAILRVTGAVSPPRR
jgi:CheY-like chemotaxis protein